MGMRMPAANSAPCTSMPMMVATKKRRFSRTRTCNMGSSKWVWRMKNHTTPAMPSAMAAAVSRVSPAEPTAEKPYSIRPKPSVDSTSESGSSFAVPSPVPK